MDLKIRFDDGPICAKTTSVNIFLDEELMAERLNDRIVKSKYKTAIGSTDAANP